MAGEQVQSPLPAPILLYHATFNDVPKAFRQRLHNVTPDSLYRQLQWVRENFDVVFVDDLFESAESTVGKCAITFDDAYQCVFDKALAVLETLKLRSSIFINGVTLGGRPMWRDIIRYMLSMGLVDAFIEENRSYCTERQITASTFYRSTKSVRVNSAEIERKLHQFLVSRDIGLAALMYGLPAVTDLIAHPLVSYGNHSFNHYVLASLSDDQQAREIGRNHAVLHGADRNVSRIFAAPFGGGADINETTVMLCKRYGYAGILCSKGKGRRLDAARGEGSYFRDRYMPSGDLADFRSEMSRFLPK